MLGTAATQSVSDLYMVLLHLPFMLCRLLCAGSTLTTQTAVPGQRYAPCGRWQ
jgi:hypothetical protein